jgi:hypothetical protein
MDFVFLIFVFSCNSLVWFGVQFLNGYNLATPGFDRMSNGSQLGKTGAMFCPKIASDSARIERTGGR